MQRMRMFPLALVAILSTAGLATAQPAERGGRMFEQIDANRDGRVTWDESWTFVTTRFTAADTDRNGTLSREEFAAWRARPADAPAPRPEQGARREEMRAAFFRALDADRNGQVSLDEVRPMVEARFRAADANADGAVIREEMPARRQPRGDAPATPR